MKIMAGNSDVNANSMDDPLKQRIAPSLIFNQDVDLSSWKSVIHTNAKDSKRKVHMLSAPSKDEIVGHGNQVSDDDQNYKTRKQFAADDHSLQAGDDLTTEDLTSDIPSTISQARLIDSNCLSKDNPFIFPEVSAGKDLNATFLKSLNEDVDIIQSSNNTTEIRFNSDHYQNTPMKERNLVKSHNGKAVSDSLSILYTLFILIIGFVCYLLDVEFRNLKNFAEIFNIYLLSIQLIWLGVMITSVRLYRKQMLLLERGPKDETCVEVNRQFADNPPDVYLKQSDPRQYGFLFGYDETSLFVKIGATILAMGYLIHVGLRIGENIFYLVTTEETIYSCTSSITIAMYSLLCLAILYQIFFAFKFSNLIINKWLIISKFAIAHCIVTSLCLSVYLIIEQITISLSNSVEDNSNSAANSTKDEPLSFQDKQILTSCNQSSTISRFTTKLDPYLYPCCIQMNFIMIGFWIMLLQNLGKTEKCPSVVDSRSDGRPPLTTRSFIQVDCHASNRGLFSGLLSISSAVIVIMVYYSFGENVETWHEALIIRSIWVLVTLVLMIMALCFAFKDVHFLDVQKCPVSQIDDTLLYICLPFVFLHSFFQLVPYARKGMMISVAMYSIQIIQVILQTLLITNGLRRCSNSASNRNKKPGREFITFLIVTNLSMWLIMAFQFNCGEECHVLNLFYGQDIWTIISKSTLPMTLLYRFQSSICFAKMWKRAYEPECYQ